MNDISYQSLKDSLEFGAHFSVQNKKEELSIHYITQACCTLFLPRDWMSTFFNWDLSSLQTLEI